ncbi:MAG: hypothetical protein R3E83_05540 [Burkholderiaceae bacterium]
MNTKLLLASIAAATTLAAPAAFAGEIYGAIERSPAASAMSAPLAFDNTLPASGELYGFPARATSGTHAGTIAAFDNRGRIGGELYGFEYRAAPGATMNTMASVTTRVESVSGALYGFETGDVAIGGTSMSSTNAQPSGILARGELYGFEAGSSTLGGVNLANTATVSNPAVAGGALYGFEAQPFGATDLGE